MDIANTKIRVRCFNKLKKGETKPAAKCVMKHCQNLRYKYSLLCHNHWRLRDKLYTYRYKYGDLKREKENIKEA